MWNGYTAVLLGTFNSATTSVNVTNLTPGSTARFLVEAYNSTSVADSAFAPRSRATFRGAKGDLDRLPTSRIVRNPGGEQTGECLLAALGQLTAVPAFDFRPFVLNFLPSAIQFLTAELAAVGTVGGQHCQFLQ
jgi:hypothetical protein